MTSLSPLLASPIHGGRDDPPVEKSGSRPTGILFGPAVGNEWQGFVMPRSFPPHHFCADLPEPHSVLFSGGNGALGRQCLYLPIAYSVVVSKLRFTVTFGWLVVLHNHSDT